MYDEVLKCFDHDSITACCSNRGILLYGPLKNHPENVQGSVFWETQPLSWMDWVEGGPFSIGQDIAPIERVHASFFMMIWMHSALAGVKICETTPFTQVTHWRQVEQLAVSMAAPCLFKDSCCLENVLQSIPAWSCPKCLCHWLSTQQHNRRLRLPLLNNWSISELIQGLCVPAIHGNAECEIWIDLVNSVIRWIRDDQITLVFSCLEWPGWSLPGIDDASSRPEEPTAPETEVCVTMLPSTQRERRLAHWKHCGPHLIWAWDVYWKYWNNLKSRKWNQFES